MKRWLYILLCSLWMGATAFAETEESSPEASIVALPSKKYEVRGVWLTTVFNLDWPKRTAYTVGDEERQKRELEVLLDRLQEAGINTVYLQTRGRGDLIYPSKVEPLSLAIRGRASGKVSYDPLEYAIEACHKRGMRVHAWMVTLPLGTQAYVRQLDKSAYAVREQRHCINYKGEWYMDPASPKTDEHLRSIVKELLEKYDVDGVHLDYIRYPSEPQNFPDEKAYRKARTTLSRDEWRQSNINRIVSSVYKQAKAIRPDVEVSAAPIGKYRRLTIPQERGWTALESVHQDPLRWEKSSEIDALVPMMYYKDDLFYPYVEDWAKTFEKTPVIMGLGSYRLLSNEGNWSLSELASQVKHIQAQKGLAGVAFFRADQVASPSYGLYGLLRDSLFVFPTLPFKGAVDDATSAPSAPHDMTICLHKDGIMLSWAQEMDKEEKLLHIVYLSASEEVDTERSDHMKLRTTKQSVLIPWSMLPQERLTTLTVSTYDIRTGLETVAVEHHAYYRTEFEK